MSSMFSMSSIKVGAESGMSSITIMIKIMIMITVVVPITIMIGKRDNEITIAIIMY